MSETQASQDATAKKVKAATVYEKVKMEDGREVEFAGTRKTDKTVLTDEAGNAYGVRFDFRNGATRQILFSDLAPAVQLYACGHGISQKAGDEYSGVKEVDDMVLAVDEIFTRLRAGDWAAPSEGGDSMAGASSSSVRSSRPPANPSKSSRPSCRASWTRQRPPARSCRARSCTTASAIRQRLPALSSSASRRRSSPSRPRSTPATCWPRWAKADQRAEG